MRIRYVLVILMLSAAVYMTYNPRELLAPEGQALQEFPAQVGEWRSVSNTLFDAPVLNVLRPTDYLMRVYTNRNGDNLGFYVGYHNGGPDSGPIHSPRNCLPGSGWFPLESTEMEFPAGSGNVRLVRVDFAKGSEQMTCYYWYQVQNETLTQDFALKLSEFKRMVFDRRKDASFIRIDFMKINHEKSDELVKNFLQETVPILKQYLPG